MGFFDDEEKEPPPQDESPVVRERKPDWGELALGYAWGEEDGREIHQLKGIYQSDRHGHFYVVGATGMGKTKFLEYMIQQDIRWWTGFTVIDPHGDLVKRVKGYLAGTKRGVDGNVFVIDPTDAENSVCFNPLEPVEGLDSGDVADELVGAFKKIWESAWGSRMEQILRNTLIALSENGLTLAEVPLILRDSAVRAKLLRNVKHETCREFFEKYDGWSERVKQEWTESTLNKIDALLSNTNVRHIFLSPKSTFNLREIMDEGKILLVNLDRGKLRDAGDLLGSLILTKIQMAAFSRSDTDEKERVEHFLYIDEFQDFAAENFVKILSQTRKYHLYLVLAHQNLAQLPIKLRASILGNCGIQAYFHVSRFDAEILAKEAFAGVYNEAQKWEIPIQWLQSLAPRVFLLKHENEGGISILTVPDADEAWQELLEDMDKPKRPIRAEDIGREYTMKRSDIEKEYRTRREALMADDEPEIFRDRK